MRLASSSWAANSSRVGARRRFDAKADVRADLASDRFQGRFDLGDNSVRVLFVELMSALERRLATARGNAQPGRLLLYGLVALCGGDDHERNGAKRQETPGSATIQVHPVDVFWVPPSERPRKLLLEIPGWGANVKQDDARDPRRVAARVVVGDIASERLAHKEIRPGDLGRADEPT